MSPSFHDIHDISRCVIWLCGLWRVTKIRQTDGLNSAKAGLPKSIFENLGYLVSFKNL